MKSSHNGTLGGVIDYVNIMFYDQSPTDMGGDSEGMHLRSYQELLSRVEKVVPKHKIVMGFEPGSQYNQGMWEGIDVDEDVIDYMESVGFGGIMFWAINHPKTGENVNTLAAYA